MASVDVLHIEIGDKDTVVDLEKLATDESQIQEIFEEGGGNDLAIEGQQTVFKELLQYNMLFLE